MTVRQTKLTANHCDTDFFTYSFRLALEQSTEKIVRIVVCPECHTYVKSDVVNDHETFSNSSEIMKAERY